MRENTLKQTHSINPYSGRRNLHPYPAQSPFALDSLQSPEELPLALGNLDDRLQKDFSSERAERTQANEVQKRKDECLETVGGWVCGNHLVDMTSPKIAVNN